MFKNMKKPCKYVVFPVSTRFYGKAADGNRTRDLRTTNATLYRLSHSSNFIWYRSREPCIYYHEPRYLSTTNFTFFIFPCQTPVRQRTQVIIQVIRIQN